MGCISQMSESLSACHFIDCRVQSGLVPLGQTVYCDHGLHWSIQILHFGRNFAFDILFLEGKILLLTRNNQVNFGDILSETSILGYGCG